MKKKSILLRAIKEERTDVDKNVMKYIKKEVTEYKHMYIANKSIGIMNLSRGAGSTFITTNLAKAFSEYEILTSVIELPLEQSKIYTNIGIEQKLSIDDEQGYINFYSYAHEIDGNGKIEKEKETYIDDIIFIVPDPHKENIESDTWDYNKMIKLLNASRKSKINLIDINNSFEHESVKGLIEEIDMLIVVIDPNPTELILNIDTIMKIKDLNNINVKYIINKFNSGIDLKEFQKLQKSFKIEPLTIVPYIDSSIVYRSLYEGKILYNYEEPKKVLKQSFIPLLQEMIPIELLKDKTINFKKNKRFGLF